MNIRRIAVLLRKDLKHGFVAFFLVFSIAGPIILTLLVNLVFGSIFSGKPKLGIYHNDHSQIVESLKEMESINFKLYSSEPELKNAVKSGSRDMGIVFSENLDLKIKKGEDIKITAYIWGESHLKDRAILGAALLYQVRELSGQKVPVDIIQVPLGDKKSIPWEDRFFPIIVLLAIFISGFTIPASSMVSEKQKHTMGAVTTTPVTQTEFFTAKGIIGIMVSMAMGILILVLNHAFNAELGLLILILFLGAIMACCIGLVVGALIKEMAVLHSVVKGLGLFVYGPGIVAFFPQIPDWVGKLFPTYYVMNPIMEISRGNGNWATVRTDLFILIGFIALFLAITGFVANKTRQQEA